MSFLAPLLLFGLPLALLPVVIHLIHLMRRRRVKWAAMMFLHAAQRMNKGLSRLRQYLILLFRVLAVAALILMAGRPLAGGLLGLTGGAPDSVIVLLDRSASMEQQLPAAGVSKRAAGLRNLSAAIRDAYGKRSRLVLIDSATLQPLPLEKPEALLDLPQTGPTDTAADVPALLQGALDYITANQTGRTDVWLLSDLRQSDWNTAGGRWTALRGAFATLPAVRFQVLAYPEAPTADLGVTVERAWRRATAEKAELLLDLRLTRGEPAAEALTVPLRVVVNGAASTLNAELKGGQALLQGLSIPIDPAIRRGWGRVELAADSSPADNVSTFVFDDPPPLKSVIVSGNAEVSGPLRAALTAAADPSRKYECAVLPPERAAEIVWEETALIVWQAALPGGDPVLNGQLEAHAQAGRALLFLPPENPDGGSFSGLRWTAWRDAARDKPALVEWWRGDAGPLAGTRGGAALPVGETEIQRWCGLEGESIPLARLGESGDRAPLLAQAARGNDGDGGSGGGGVYFLATLPSAGFSTLARDGVALFALLHRTLNDGAATLGNARGRDAGKGALGDDPGLWTRPDAPEGTEIPPTELPLRAGVLLQKAPGKPEVLLALNRPASEDAPGVVGKASLEELFAGLDWRLLERTLGQEKSLTSEVWRTFLMLMAAALVLEAVLCLPPRRPTPAVAGNFGKQPA